MRGLDGRTIRHRVREGNAELEGIRPSGDCGADDIHARLRSWIAQHDERDKRALILLTQRGKKFIVTAAHD